MLRNRLHENEPVQAKFILVRGNMIEERPRNGGMDGLAKMERGEFERTGRDLVRRLAMLRTLGTEAGTS